MPDKQVIALLSPAHFPLTQDFVDRIGKALTAQGAKILSIAPLAEDKAWDIVFDRIEKQAALQIALDILGDKPVDVIVQEAGNRQKQLLITDMDSTIITCECIDELADFAGFKAEVAAITERAMNGELDFAAALETRVRLLAGVPESALQSVYDERVKFMPGAKELVQTMRANGAYCVLVSGGFTFFTSRVREAVGFHQDYSNTLEIAEGKLTGRVIPPILGKDAKLQALLNLCHQRSISLQDTLAIGDGSNDLPMLLAAGLGVAYHAKPMVRAAAQAQINHCDLSALLYVQGYQS